MERKVEGWKKRRRGVSEDSLPGLVPSFCALSLNFILK